MPVWISQLGVDLGFLPGLLSDEDPRPAAVQFNERYAYGGGWQPRPKFTLQDDNSLEYPGDPPLRPCAQAILRDELILLYPQSWVVIKQKDGSIEVARID